MKPQDFQIHSTGKLDKILVKCCELIIKYYQKDPDYWGRVAACVLDPDNNAVFGVNHRASDGTSKHGERVAIENYEKKYGTIPEGSIIITTLSPCSLGIADRYEESCTDLVANKGVRKVYCGYSDPTQSDSDEYIHKKFHEQETRNEKIRELCKKIADTFLDDVEIVEN